MKKEVKILDGQLLPLAEHARPCVRSGFCCQNSPCSFGEPKSDSDLACIHLESTGDGRYACGIAEDIINQQGWEFSPAFGAGCCQPMFNPNRERIIREAREAGLNPYSDL